MQRRATHPWNYALQAENLEVIQSTLSIAVIELVLREEKVSSGYIANHVSISRFCPIIMPEQEQRTLVFQPNGPNFFLS